MNGHNNNINGQYGVPQASTGGLGWYCETLSSITLALPCIGTPVAEQTIPALHGMLWHGDSPRWFLLSTVLGKLHRQ